MQKISLGIQEFSEFKQEGVIYVDKTKVIHELVNRGKYYFLSRPRRFGKSLLVSTLRELFEGNQELFEECWIYDQWNWEKKFPVIKISFSELSYRTHGLEKALELYLEKLATLHSIQLETTSYSEQFLELIEKLGEAGKVVVLIDEYDKPIIDYLEKSEVKTAQENREILKTLYSGVKDQDKYIRFLLLTGVSKFSKVSIFSDLNHLTDISIHDDYSTILGYSEAEIKKYYSEYLKFIAKKFDLSQPQLLGKIKEWYNGYSWNGIDFMYNPYSVLRLFDAKSFDNYWFESGSPTFLIKELKNSDKKIDESINRKVNRMAFNKYDIEHLNITAIMFQTGYLTIKNVDLIENQYTLDFPNKEVRESFLNFAVEHYANSSPSEMEYITESLLETLENQDLDSFLVSFQSLFSSITTKQLDKVKSYEGFYHSIIFIVLKLLGVHVQCEIQSSFGATDTIIQTQKTIYILEFKAKSAKAALAQIHKKKYYQPYLADQREIVVAGISFDPQARNLSELLSEIIKK